MAVAPIADRIGSDLGWDAATVGLLTGLPALCFAILTPFASQIVRGFGPHLAVTTAILGIGIGIIVRSSGEAPAAIVGTLLIGGFIAIGNVAVPVVVRRDIAPARFDLVSGIFTAALNLGTMATSALAVPLTRAFSWRVALALWCVLVVGAGAAWVGAVGLRSAVRRRPLRATQPVLLHDPGDAPAPAVGPAPTAARRPPRWWWWHRAALPLAVAFAGQSFVYFGLTAWMPAILVGGAGLTPGGAGAAAAVFQISAIPGALAAPWFQRRFGMLGALAGFEVLYVLGPVGLLLAPAGWPVWSAAGGMAQGGAYSLLFLLVVRISRDENQVRVLAALTQAFGYLAAAVAPSLLGALWSSTGSWSAPLIALVVAAVTCAVSAIVSVFVAGGEGHAAQPRLLR